MANSTAICNSFKTEMMNGHHAFGTAVVRAGTTADTFKAALFTTSATLSKSTTAYSATNEASGTGYSAGGVTVTNANVPANTSDTSYWTPSASFAWTTVTFTTVDACLLYNSTQSNKAVAVYTFSSQSVTAGNFTLTMPTNDQTTGLLRFA
jgi:hypothetical protein